MDAEPAARAHTSMPEAIEQKAQAPDLDTIMLTADVSRSAEADLLRSADVSVSGDLLGPEALRLSRPYL